MIIIIYIIPKIKDKSQTKKPFCHADWIQVIYEYAYVNVEGGVQGNCLKMLNALLSHVKATGMHKFLQCSV